MSALFPCYGSDQTREQVVAPRCLKCDDELALHQPDPGLPQRLLAVCESCKTWYVSNASGTLLTPIPIEEDRWRRRRLRG